MPAGLQMVFWWFSRYIVPKGLFTGVGEDMSDFRHDQHSGGKGHGSGRPGYAEDDTSTNSTGDCPGKHGGRPDLLVTFNPEKFPEAIHFLFKKRDDGLNSTVIMSQTGT